MSVAVAYSVRESIRSCTACDLYKGCQAPVPWSGRTPAQIVILGMAPGLQEDKAGAPFVGPAGFQMRASLKKAKINPRLVAWMNAVQCFPGRGKGGDVEPTRAQLAACRTNMLDQIDVLQPQFIILTGKVALHAFRPDLSIGDLHGKPMYYNGREARIADSPERSVTWDPGHIVLWPTYHPAAALRQVKYEAALDDDLAAFWAYRTDRGWYEKCYVCGEEEITFDAWGVAKCPKHLPSQPEFFPVS